MTIFICSQSASLQEIPINAFITLFAVHAPIASHTHQLMSLPTASIYPARENLQSSRSSSHRGNAKLLLCIILNCWNRFFFFLICVLECFAKVQFVRLVFTCIFIGGPSWPPSDRRDAENRWPNFGWGLRADLLPECFDILDRTQRWAHQFLELLALFLASLIPFTFSVPILITSLRLR